MSLTSKIFCFLVLLSSFLLMLATGQSNVRNFEQVQEAIAEIYQDRLVVKGLIFELSSSIHEKEIALISNDVNYFKRKNQAVNAKINENLRAFRETKLTEEEASTLESFARRIEELKSSEAKGGLEKIAVIPGEYARNLAAQIDRLKVDLKTLSEIQLSEGKEKLKSGKYAVKRMNEFANLEYYALILIGVFMLGLFFVPKPKDVSAAE